MTKNRAAGILLIAIGALVLFFILKSFVPSWFGSSRTLPSISQHELKKTWVCPMHPEIVQDHPGQCPICGMDLVEARNSADHEHGIHVDNATVQRLGIRLMRTKLGEIGQDIPVPGNVVAAENAIFSVQPRYEGWIKKLYVHAAGETVKAGQVLYEIYSPDLINRQRTYLSSIERRKQVLKTIPTTADTENDYVMQLTMDAANDRAKLHQEEGLSIESIQAIEDSKEARDVVKIVAANGGVVTQLNVRAGALVTSSTVMMQLVDTSQVWIEATLYPDQVNLVNNGDPVTISIAGMPAINARIDFVSPVAESNKVRARIYLDNRQYHLRPGTFADLAIHTRSHQATLLPRSAIIYTAQGKLVMLYRGDGHFLPVPVETGVESGEWVELLDGLVEGAEVAVNGQFLLDAASSMSAASERMSTH